MFFLPAIVASLGMAQAAVVTVTQHVHENAIVSVEGVLYVENGQTQTTFITEGGATPTSISNKIGSTVIAPAGASGSSINTAGLESALNDVAVASNSGASPTSASVAAETAAASGSPTTLAPSTSAAAVTTSSAAATTSASPSPSTTAAAPSSSAAPTSTSSSASASASGSSSTFQSAMVSGHNNKRSLHESTGSLEWDDTLATYAQNYADNYDCSGDLVHSGGSYGENLAVGYDDQGTIDAWYDEIKKYNFDDPSYSESTGHFTQVVWKSSTKVGCGYKQCGGSVGKYVICSYNPAGNFIGEFAENVMSLSS